MIRGVEHTGIVAKDPAKLVKWYEDHLAFKTIRVIGTGTYFIQAPCGTILEVYTARNEENRNYDNYTPGWRHLAIDVEDFDAEYKKLMEDGVEIAAEPVINDQIKLVLFKDCEGNLCHLIERISPLK